MAEYRAAIDGAPAPPAKSAGTASIEWLIRRYRDSSAWLALALATREQRENIFRDVIKGAGDVPFSAVTRAKILDGRERRLATPNQANNFLKSMRGLFRWALEAELVAIDPTAGVKGLPIKTEGFREWTDDDVAKFESRWPIGTRERVALDILLYTGLRRGDACRLGRQMVKGGIFRIKTEKNGVEVIAPILSPLARTLERGPVGDLHFITGPRGGPLTKESFGNWFREACHAAGVPGAAHGLRKAGANRAAENGATNAQLKAIFGWTTDAMPNLYTRKADRARMAAAAMSTMERAEYEVSISILVDRHAAPESPAGIQLVTAASTPSGNVTYYVVVPFDRNEIGDLAAGAAQEVPSSIAAERRARSLAIEHAGAVAFSRTGDPSVGEFQDATIIAQFGDVALDALSE
jgi:integrase